MGCALASALMTADVSVASSDLFSSGRGVLLDFFGARLATDPSGNVVVAGTQCSESGDCQVAVSKFTRSGAPVASFGVNGKTLARIGSKRVNSGNAVTVDGQGNVYVGGTTRNALDEDHDFALFKFDGSGRPVDAFGNGGTQTVDFALSGYDIVTDLALDRKGNVWLAGLALHNLFEFAIAKIGVTGSVVAKRSLRFSDFGPDDNAKAVVTDDGGNAYVAGTQLFGSSVPWRFCQLVKLDPDGTPAASFGIDGKRIVEFGTGGTGCTAMARDPSGNLVIVGSMLEAASSENFVRKEDIVVVKLDLNGNRVASFGTNGIATVDVGVLTDDKASAVVVDPSGNVYVVGNTAIGVRSAIDPSLPPSVEYPVYGMVVVKLDANGNLSDDFGNRGRHHFVANGDPRGMAQDAVMDVQGAIYVVGDVPQALGTKSIIMKVSTTAATATAVEYFHADFGHYFVTASPVEITALDAGQFEGWTRTGQLFDVWTANASGLATMCRFFSAAFAPRSSHFYTPDSAECNEVRDNTVWQYEGVAGYSASPTATGTCLIGIPLYRLYNNGMSGAPNHRYTTSVAMRSAMLTQGWTPEGLGPLGVIACVPA